MAKQSYRIGDKMTLFSLPLPCLCCPLGFVVSQFSKSGLGGVCCLDHSIVSYGMVEEAVPQWYKGRRKTSGHISTREAALPPMHHKEGSAVLTAPRRNSRSPILASKQKLLSPQHEKDPWRIEKWFRARTKAHGFIVPSDLQHLSARTASPLLPTFSFWEEQGYFPVTVYLSPLQESSEILNSFLISMNLFLFCQWAIHFYNSFIFKHLKNVTVKVSHQHNSLFYQS